MSGAPRNLDRLRSPWRSRPFRLLTAGMTVSVFGSSITPVAIAFAVPEVLVRLG